MLDFARNGQRKITCWRINDAIKSLLRSRRNRWFDKGVASLLEIVVLSQIAGDTGRRRINYAKALINCGPESMTFASGRRPSHSVNLVLWHCQVSRVNAGMCSYDVERSSCRWYFRRIRASALRNHCATDLHRIRRSKNLKMDTSSDR